MRIKPLPPETLSPDLRFVHDEIKALITRSQGQVGMIDDYGALLGPFPPMLRFPQFGIPALTFLRSLDQHATLDKRVREVAILTVAGAYSSRFQLYAHEIMAAAFGISADVISTLAAGGRPFDLNEQEAIAHDIAFALVYRRVISSSTYHQGEQVLGSDGLAELIFLISGYTLISTILNGFDVPAPEINS